MKEYPHLAGVYTTEDTAEIICSRLIDAGLPVAIDEVPLNQKPAGIIIENEDGRPAAGPAGSVVWVVRTDYNQNIREIE